MPNIYILLVIVFSSLVKGITGFGFALVSLPILLYWYDPKEIIPVLMICNLLASLFIVLQKKEHKLIDKNSILLIIAGGLFTAFGVLLLKSIHSGWLIHVSGVVFIVLILLSLIRNKSNSTEVHSFAYPLVGAIIGLITGVVSISGPPLALFLNRANVENQRFREIFAWFSILTATVAIVTYSQIGLLNRQVIEHSLCFAPILLMGSFAGKHLNKLLPIKSFRAINIILSMVSCILLLLS